MHGNARYRCRLSRKLAISSRAQRRPMWSEMTVSTTRIGIVTSRRPTSDRGQDQGVIPSLGSTRNPSTCPMTWPSTLTSSLARRISAAPAGIRS